MKAWILLGIAIVGELIGTSSLKLANGMEKPWAWGGVIGGFGTALWLLALVIQEIDISVVYALWSGVGIALVALVGVVVFGETMSWMRGLGLVAIAVGIALVQFSTKHSP